MFADSADVCSVLVELPFCKWPLPDPGRVRGIAIERTIKALHQK